MTDYIEGAGESALDGESVADARLQLRVAAI